MIYSGFIATSGTSSVNAIAPITGNVNTYFTGGWLINDNGSPAGQYTIDNGANWIDFDAGPAAKPLPAGNYVNGVQIRRAHGSDAGASEPDVVAVRIELYP